jgi:hypothetical protein
MIPPATCLIPRLVLVLLSLGAPSFGVIAQDLPSRRATAPSTEVSIPTNPFSASFELTTSRSIRMELAYKAVADQIEAKRDKERNASALAPFWQAGFWRYIPFVPGGPSKLVEDPFATPNYLLLSYRQSDLGLAISERRSLWEIVSGRNGERKR